MRKPYAIVALALIAVAALFSGLSFMRQNWGANQTPGALERFVARLFLSSSDNGGAELKNPLLLSPENVEAGRTLYKMNCVFCHGEDGRGPGEKGPQFYPPVPSLAEPSANLTDSRMFYIINRGIRYTAMPSFEKVLSKDETWQVIQFVDQLAHPAPSPASAPAAP